MYVSIAFGMSSGMSYGTNSGKDPSMSSGKSSGNGGVNIKLKRRFQHGFSAEAHDPQITEDTCIFVYAFV